MNTRALSGMGHADGLSLEHSFSIKRRRLMTAPPPPGKFPAYYTRNHPPARLAGRLIIHARNTSRSIRSPNRTKYSRIPEYKVNAMELMSNGEGGGSRLVGLGVKNHQVSCEQPQPNFHRFLPSRASHIITIRRRGRFSDE